MYLAYNCAAIEKLGKPTAMLVGRSFMDDARTGVTVKDVPGLRLVQTNMLDVSSVAYADPDAALDIMRPGIIEIMDDIVAALTKPLTAEEKSPPKKAENPPRIIFQGDLQEVNIFFYRRGWRYGFPIIPPTEEAVAEMLTGTDLSPDCVVAKLPVRLGKATVEKIAINAVMAGCLPTYMPVLIAGVQVMLDPKLLVQGSMCSAASWAPLWIINGPIRNDLHLNSGPNLMSRYDIASAAIGHALSLIIMNIGGVGPGIADMGALGHEGRIGMVIAENEEASPWEPFHVTQGLKKEDSAITNIWPNFRANLGFGGPRGKGAAGLLSAICHNIRPGGGFHPGGALVLAPVIAKTLDKEGWTKKEVLSYIKEYTRRPAAEFDLPWLLGNFHATKEELPVDDTSMRVFLRPDRVFIIVASGSVDDKMGIITQFGAGDYGGPATKKIELPANWNQLVKKYKDIVPTYTHH